MKKIATMRKIIFGVLLCSASVQALNIYNETEVKETAALVGLQMLTGLLPDNDFTFGPKFGVQFGAGVHNPVAAALVLGAEYARHGGPSTLSVASSMFNRALAQNLAERCNTTETNGYVVAAAVNAVGISILSDGPLRQGLIQWKLCGALVNGLEKEFLKQGMDPASAGLMTSSVTGGLAALLLIAHSSTIPPGTIDAKQLRAARQINLNVATTLVAETGFRLLPSMMSAETMKLVLGLPLYWIAQRMPEGVLKTFAVNTGISFMIGTGAEIAGSLKRLAI